MRKRGHRVQPRGKPNGPRKPSTMGKMQKPDVNGMQRRMPSSPEERWNSEDHGTHYWIKANHEGKVVVLGPYSDERQAYEAGYSRLDGQFEVIPLNTRNPSAATQRIRAMRMENEGVNLGDALKRMKRKLG